MKKYLSIFIAMAALVIAGCEQIENNAPETNDGTTPAQMTISAEIGVDTKVDYSDGAAELKWKKEGETITVFFYGAGDAEGKNHKVLGYKNFDATSVSEDGKSAEFTGDLIDGAKTFRCVYPAIKEGESETAFTYDLTTQTGNYEESQTFMYTYNNVYDENEDKSIDVPYNLTADGKPEKAVVFSHWTYIINATLNFGESVEGSASDIKFTANEKFTSKKVFQAKEGGSVGSTSSTKGEAVTIGKAHTLANGKANVVVYGFGDNNIGNIKFTCKVNDRVYEGILAGRGKNCQNGKQYSPEITMIDVTRDPDKTVLTFPFKFTKDETVTLVSKGWPSEGTKLKRGSEPISFSYEMDNGDKYDFSVDDTNVTEGNEMKIYYRHKSGDNPHFRMDNNTYLGLPIITGKKLVKVQCVNARTDDNGGAGITSKIYTTSETKTYINGGSTIAFPSQQRVDFTLKETQINTRYYLVSTQSSGFCGFNELVLYYE